LIYSPYAKTNVTVTNIVGTNVVVTNQTVSTFGCGLARSPTRPTTNDLQGVGVFKQFVFRHWRQWDRPDQPERNELDAAHHAYHRVA